MKKFLQLLTVSLVTMLVVTMSCKKSSDSASNDGGDGTSSDVRVTTYTPQDITATTAVCGGDAIVTQGLALSEIGVCWSAENNPMVGDSHLSTTEWDAPFVCTITGLEPNTKYYVRAYALRGLEYYYGGEKSFTTSAYNLPTLTTGAVSGITTTSAACGGNVTSAGDGTVVVRGVCWSTEHNPTTEASHTSDGSGVGVFTSSITGLEHNTTYYVRAYATSDGGTSYGNEVSFTTLNTPEGAVAGLFSVSPTQQVYFSQGNLQYQASTRTWRFAEHQWDYIGNDNANISSSYSGWIDLFGWGTGNNPTNISTSSSDYSTFNDWGNNSISNGGGRRWFTLTRDEWVYVFNTRSTSSGIRYAKATVNGVNGVILLPDNWSSSNYSLSNTNNGNASFSSNRISQSDWTNLLEANGAVFLPAAGWRYGTSVNLVGSYGQYWSASYTGSANAYGVYFSDGFLYADDWNNGRNLGRSVRLVCSAE